ncbi:signal peptidase I [[Brevibacterium] frigoritolerans]|nr:signal peptidase I [Peribacillus frigoritolerans]
MKRAAQKKQKRKELKKEFFSYIRDIFIITGLVFLVKIYVLDFGIVYGHSMEPNLKDNQIILIKKWDIHLGEKGNGIDFYDIALVDNVEFNGEKQPINIVKRVIGLPGDHIEIINGDIIRNGKKIKEPLIKEKASQMDQSFVIEEGQIFVMGDNRNHSTDSRMIGTLPISKVSGEVIANFQADGFIKLSQQLRLFLHLKVINL